MCRPAYFAAPEVDVEVAGGFSPGFSGLWFAQVHRSFSGIWSMTLGMCCPQPHLACLKSQPSSIYAQTQDARISIAGESPLDRRLCELRAAARGGKSGCRRVWFRCSECRYGPGLLVAALRQARSERRSQMSGRAASAGSCTPKASKLSLEAEGAGGLTSFAQIACLHMTVYS